MDNINDVTEEGCNIPALIHSVVINTVNRREHLSLQPADSRVCKNHQFVPNRTRTYMIRANGMIGSHTIDFENKIEYALFRMRPNEICFPNSNDSECYLHSVSIYTVFTMDCLDLDINNPLVMLSAAFLPSDIIRYTTSGITTIAERDSRILRHLLCRACAEFTECTNIQCNDYFDQERVESEFVQALQTPDLLYNNDFHLMTNFVPQTEVDTLLDPEVSLDFDFASMADQVEDSAYLMYMNHIRDLQGLDAHDNYNLSVCAQIEPNSESVFLTRDQFPNNFGMSFEQFEMNESSDLSSMSSEDDQICVQQNFVETNLINQLVVENAVIDIDINDPDFQEVLDILTQLDSPNNDVGDYSSDHNMDVDGEGINLQSGIFPDVFVTFSVVSLLFSYLSKFILTGTTIYKIFQKSYEIVVWFFDVWHFKTQMNMVKRYANTSASDVLHILHNMPDRMRLRLVDIKSMLHALYFVYQGNFFVASTHMTTMFVTQPLNLGTILLNGSVIACHYAKATKFSIFECEGKKCVVDGTEFERLCKISDSGKQVTLNDVNESIEIQAGELQEVANNIGSLFAQWQVGEKTVKDIEIANKQFAYMRNVSNVVSDRANLMMILLRLILRTGWSYDPLDVQFQLFAVDVVDCGVEIKNMANNKNRICSDKKIMLEVIALHKRATAFVVHARMQSMPGCVQRYFSMRYKEIDEMCTMAHQYLLGAQQRAEPVCIFLRGAPGSGKSLFTLFAMHAIDELDGQEFSAEKCYTLSKDKFWEGYSGQKYCNSDDVFQILTKTTLQDEADRIIRMNNSTPFNLPMAFDGKGSTFFDSEYVFLSSNYGKTTKWPECTFEELGISDVGAIKRRLNIVLERSTRSEADVMDNTYYVAQCDHFPKLVGSNMKPCDLVKVIHEMRKIHVDRLAKSKISRNRLRSALGLELVKEKEIELFPVTKSVTMFENTTDFFTDLSDNIKQMYVDATSKPIKHDPSQLPLNVDDDGIKVLNDLKRFEHYMDMPSLLPNRKGLIEEDVDMILQNGEIDNRKPPTAVEWILKILPIQLCEWFDSPYAKWIMYGFTIIVAAVVFKKIFEKLFPSQFEEQSYKNKFQYGWQPTKNFKATRVQIHPSENFGYSTVPQVVLQSKEVQEIIPQSVLTDFHSSLVKTLSKGVGLLEMFGEDNQKRYHEFGIAFHIKDGCMITPSHLMLKYTAEDMKAHMILHIDGKVYKMNIPEHTWKIDSEDVVLFMLPKSVPRPVALYKYLLRAEKSPSIHPLQEVYQIGIGFNNEVVIRNYNRVPKTGSVNHLVDGEIIVYDLGFTYVGDCQKGHSGSPSIVCTLDGPKIVGMHVGATKKENIGITFVLCQEWFDQIFSTMETQSASTLPVVVDHTVPFAMANNLPKRTRIRKSPIYGWNGVPNNIPARFIPFENDKGEIVDPLVVAMSKLKQEHFESPEDLHKEKVMEFLKTTYPPRDDARLFTYDEALNGVPERKIPSIVGSTSAGYPYCLNAKKGKNPYVVQENNRYTYQEEFLKNVKSMEEQLRKGEQISVIWADTLKDETRPREKVMQGKTRLFTSCPLHYLVLVRRYFLDFVGRVQELAATHPVSVGINPHSLQWTLLYQRMAELNGSIIAGDFSNYDGSVPAFVGRIVLDFINEWYMSDDIDAQVRALLFEHLWNGVRICGDKIYFTKDGNPSGNPLTSIFNSLINMIMCYIILTQDFKLLEDEFRMAMYGDDNIISTSRVGLRCSDFTPHFKRRFGMTYTHFTKVEGNDPLDSMDTIRYLGRSFIKYMTVMRAPLTLETILESTYWVRGSDVENVAFISTIRSACLELSHFPLSDYNKYVDQLFDSVRAAGLLPHYKYLLSMRRTWFDYHCAFYDESRKISEEAYEIRKLALAHVICDTYSDPASVIEEEAVEIVCQSGGNTEPIFHGEVSDSRNVQFTERAANQAPQSQGLQLGQIQDVAPVTSGVVGDGEYQDPMKSCNMELFQLDRTLDREYLLGNITWAVASGSGTILGSYSFPQVLFAQTYIAQKVEDFRFFRAGVRFSIRLTSNKFLYGSIMVVYVPQLDTNDSLPTQMGIWSGYPHMLISASAGEAAIFDVPFIYNRRAIDLRETISDQMGRFIIIVNNPLIDISGTVSTANIMVTAQFMNAELFLPHSDSVASFVIQSGRGKEARVKSEKNSVSSVFNATTAIESALSAAPLASSYLGGAITTIKVAKAAKDMLGLSKPRTSDMTSVLKLNPFSDINTGMGIDLMPTLGMDPENQISTKPNVGGIGIDEMDFKQLCGTPVLTSIHNIGPTTTKLELEITEFAAGAFGTFGNYADWLCNLFSFVSGSKKIKIYFMASQFHSARMVLYIADDANTDTWQNCYHRIIDVQGDTQVEFTLPYTSSYLSEWATGQTIRVGLYLTVLSWSQPDSSINTQIFANTYSAAASDLQFGGLKDIQFVAQSCPRNDFAKDFEPFHVSMTGFEHENLLYGEKYESVRHIIHRYSALAPVSAMQYSVNHYSGRGSIVTGTYAGMEILGLVYNFWRGSTRVKLITLPNAMQSAIIYSQTNSVLKGTAISSTANPLIEIELPYYFNTLYASTRSTTTQRAEAGNATHPMFVLKAAGDDFSFHFIRPPPLGTFAYGAQYGYAALHDFLLANN